ncbi:MAG: hypothetical protein JWQ02_2634 [Capsulimonas sp.]|nr:hypothetical protein [Capsulimonas sp.]
MFIVTSSWIREMPAKAYDKANHRTQGDPNPDIGKFVGVVQES